MIIAVTLPPVALLHYKPVAMLIVLALANLGQLAHGTQTARTNVDSARCAIDLHTTTLYVKYETTACAMLRMGNVVPVHWLALTYVTTTCCHMSPSL
jgi:hypothetical protein